MAFHVCRVGTRSFIHSANIYFNRAFSVLLRVTHTPSARLMPCEKQPVVSSIPLWEKHQFVPNRRSQWLLFPII